MAVRGFSRIVAVGFGLVIMGGGGGACEMDGGPGFIFLAQKDELLHEREMQQGRDNPRCHASEKPAGQHTLYHVWTRVPWP